MRAVVVKSRTARKHYSARESALGSDTVLQHYKAQALANERNMREGEVRERLVD
jgi:hypothetical protein